MIPGLTIAERAELFGLSYRAQLEIEQRERWLKSWSARFGDCPAKVRVWHAAGRPRADLTELAICADPSIASAVFAVLERAPACVSHHVITGVVVIGSGVETIGACSNLPRLPCESPQLVRLAVADHGCIAHELAHAMHRRPSPAPVTSAERRADRDRVCAFAVESGMTLELSEIEFQREVAADVLARSWGFDVDTTSGPRGERRRRRLLADIQRRSDAGKKES